MPEADELMLIDILNDAVLNGINRSKIDKSVLIKKFK